MSKRGMGEICLYVMSLAYLFLLTSITQDSLRKEISTHCDSLLLDPEIEALSVGIIQDGKVYKYHKGSLLTGEKPRDANLYEIASLTKTFTGTLLAQAIVEGRIKLEDDIRAFLPGNYPNLAYEGHPIRIKNIITHQGGLPRILPDKKGLFEDPDFDTLPFEIRELQQDYGKVQFYEDLKKLRLDTIPGHRFSYSNAGANLLGYLLEEVYQTPFEQLIQAQIFQPLGMKNTEIHWSKAEQKVLVEGQSHKKIKMPFMPEQYMSAAGGIVSNVGDMINYMSFHLNSDDPVIAIAHQELWEGKYGDFDAGFFWQIVKEKKNPDQFFQNGGAFGTSSWITLIPEKKIGIFLVCNTSGPEIHQKLKNTVDSILEALEK